MKFPAKVQHQVQRLQELGREKTLLSQELSSLQARHKDMQARFQTLRKHVHLVNFIGSEKGVFSKGSL